MILLRLIEHVKTLVNKLIDHLHKQTAVLRTGFAHILKVLNMQENKAINTGMVRTTGVLKLIPVSRSTWLKGVKAGIYPAGIKLSEKITVWKISDIQALLDQPKV